MQLLILSAESYTANKVSHAFHEVDGKAISIQFKTGTIIREKAFREDQSVYDYVNRFTKTLSPARQNKILDLYSQARKLLDQMTLDEFIDDNLRDVCTQLAAQYPVEEITRWLIQPGIMVWPSEKEAPLSYENAGSKKFPREKTYLLPDYQNLLALTIQLRVFTPIMAEYQEIALYKNPPLEKNRINRMFIDVVRLRLLDESIIPMGEGWRKLKEYVQAMIKSNNKAAKAPVMEVMSESDFDEWLLANVVMRKLSIQNLRPAVDNDFSAFVVRHICCHILEQLRRAERDLQPPKPTNESTGGGGDEEGNLSQFEAVRAKEQLPNGDVQFIQIGMEDPYKLAKLLEPDIPTELVKEFLNLYEFPNFVPARPQVTVTLWVLAPEVSPRSEVNMNRVNMSQNIAVAGAVLWHRGHKELATLITSNDQGPVVTDEIRMAGSTRSRTPMYNQLSELFPYHIRSKLTERTYRPVAEAVVLILSEFTANSWTPTLSPALKKDVKQIIIETPQFSMLQIPQDLSEMLYRMVTDIAARPLRNDPFGEADRIAKEMGLM